MNMYEDLAGHPIGDIDPSGEIHINIFIAPNRLGWAYEYADPGDEYYDSSGDLVEAHGGELIRSFRVSNRPTSGHTPYPDGTHYITGIEHKYRMGGNYPVTRGKNDAAGKAGKWLHSYPRKWRKGRRMGKKIVKYSWKSKTYGCMRADPDSLDKVVEDINRNSDDDDNRLIVKHLK
jgi:hypothetical protein